ncbi:MAG: DUF3137 domain-containing protein [Bacteroidetes bacterium]|nr:DUF3137 domain-containing protein [Bacteroidota bacterium]
MKTKEEIKTYFDNELLADLKSFDVRKKKAKSSALIFRILSNIGLLCLIFCYYYPPVFVIIAFCSLGIYIYFHLKANVIVTSENIRIYTEYKGRIVTDVLNEIFDNVNYIPYQHISLTAIKESDIFGEFFNFDEGEDYFKCEIKDVIFQFSEISLSGDVSVLLPDYYKGIFALTEFNKKFNTQTLIIPKSHITFYKNKYQRIAGLRKGFAKIKLEDPVFNNEFIVYGEDQVESRYLLTTSMMENMLKFKNSINSRIVFSFAENRLNLFIINTKNLFEPPKRKSFTDFEHFYKNISYFIQFASIVEELKLNINIWGKH